MNSEQHPLSWPPRFLSPDDEPILKVFAKSCSKCFSSILSHFPSRFVSRFDYRCFILMTRACSLETTPRDPTSPAAQTCSPAHINVETSWDRFLLAWDTSDSHGGIAGQFPVSCLRRHGLKVHPMSARAVFCYRAYNIGWSTIWFQDFPNTIEDLSPLFLELHTNPFRVSLGSPGGGKYMGRGRVN